MRKEKLITKLEESHHGIMVYAPTGADRFLFFTN